jgi:hypothetical protein
VKKLPRSYSKGAQKAFGEFQQFYGETEGVRIFFQKAEEQGRGKTKRQRVNSIFAVGAKLPRRA